MALNQEMGRTLRDGSESESIVSQIPFLVGLWRQLGVDALIKRTPTEEPGLFAALQSEIIPRLAIASRLPDAYPALVHFGSNGERTAFTQGERIAFLDSLLSEEASAAGSLAEAHLSRGHSLQTILLDLFAWAACELGELWDDDRVSFVDVTIGLCRLHEALHRTSEQAGLRAAAEPAGMPSILIAIAPGEQHAFGALMASELFRKEGWSVTTDTSGDPLSITKILASRRFDIAGLSVSHVAAIDGLAPLIKAMRAASKNPSLKLVVGGQLFEQSPEIAQEIGADGIAGRGLEAPQLARKMLAIS